MTIKELLEERNLTIAEFSRLTGIPYRTAQNWTLDGYNHREPPQWQLRMIAYYVETEGWNWRTNEKS